jgi:hypothetical protein
MTEQILEFELAEDVQDFIALNPDVTYSDAAIKATIQQADPSGSRKAARDRATQAPAVRCNR